MGRVVNSKIRKTEENFFTALEVALEGRTTVACMVTPKVMSSCKSLVAFLALERLLKAGHFIAAVFKLLLVHVGPQLNPVFVCVSEVSDARLVL